MGTNGIAVDSEGLRGAAVRVDGIAGNFQAELKALESIVTETGSYMQNGPQQSFEAKFAQFKDTMTNFVGALNEYSRAMKEYASNTDDIVRLGAQRFENI